MVLHNMQQRPPFHTALLYIGYTVLPPGGYNAYSNLQISIHGRSPVFKQVTFLSPLARFHYHINTQHKTQRLPSKSSDLV